MTLGRAFIPAWFIVFGASRGAKPSKVSAADSALTNKLSFEVSASKTENFLPFFLSPFSLASARVFDLSRNGT